MATFTSQPSNGYDKQIESAGWNTYTDDFFRVGEANDAARKGRGLIKFEEMSNIPSDVVAVSSATLTLTPIADSSDNTRTMRVYILKRDWVLAQATWSVYSTGNNWQTAGAEGANDIYTTDIGSVSVASNQTLNSPIDISLNTTEILKMLNGTYPNYGFMLKKDTENNDQHAFASSRHATESKRPKLVIVYTAGSGRLMQANWWL